MTWELIAIVIIAAGILSWQQWCMIQRMRRAKIMRDRAYKWSKRGRY